MPLELLIFLALYATLGLLAIVLLIIGVVGRQVSDHPFCTRCGADLVNEPGASICPSCGAFLNVDSAVTRGRRAKRRGAVALGGVLLIVTLGLGAGTWFAERQGADWNRFKPFTLLRMEAMGDDDLRARAALAELHDRVAGHQLPTHQHETLMNLALARHGVADNPRRQLWADILRTAHETHQLDTARWKRFGEQK